MLLVLARAACLLVFLVATSAIASPASVRSLPTNGVDGRLATIGYREGFPPVIAHYDETFRDIVLELCSDDECSSSSRQIVARSSSVPDSDPLSVALTHAGSPVLVYQVGGGPLRLLNCLTQDCAGRDTPTDVATDPSLGGALFIAGDGLPRIVYRSLQEVGVRELRLISCNNPACTSRSSRLLDGPIVSTTGGFGSPHVHVGDDGLARLVYSNESRHLRYLRCLDAMCSATSPPVTLSTSVVRLFPVSTTDAEGLTTAAFSTGQDPNNKIRVVRCADVDCTSIASEREVAMPELVSPLEVNVVVPTDDRPWLAIRDSSDNSVHGARCRDRSCTRADVVRLSGTDQVGVELDLVGLPAGRALLAYRNVTKQDLEIATCSIDQCPSSLVFSNGFEHQ